jgi:hypothetical protein
VLWVRPLVVSLACPPTFCKIRHQEVMSFFSGAGPFRRSFATLSTLRASFLGTACRCSMRSRQPTGRSLKERMCPSRMANMKGGQRAVRQWGKSVLRKSARWERSSTENQVSVDRCCVPHRSKPLRSEHEHALFRTHSPVRAARDSCRPSNHSSQNIYGG